MEALVLLGKEARVGKAPQSQVTPHGEEGFMYALGHRAKEDGTLIEYKSNTICENTLPVAIAVAANLEQGCQEIGQWTSESLLEGDRQEELAGTSIWCETMLGPNCQVKKKKENIDLCDGSIYYTSY